MTKTPIFLKRFTDETEERNTVYGMIDNQIKEFDYNNVFKNLLDSAIFQNHEELRKGLEELLKKCDCSVDTVRLLRNLLGSIYHHGFCDSNAKRWIEEYIAQLDKQETPYISVYENFVELYQGLVNVQGVSLLCPELDKRTGGLVPGTLCTIAGGPGCMKSTLAVNICWQAAKKGFNTCYLSLEETRTNLFLKLMSRISCDIQKNIPVSAILRKKLDSEQEEILFEEVYPKFLSAPGVLEIMDDTLIPNYETLTIEEKLKEWDTIIQKKSLEKTGKEGHGIDILVIDHVQILKFTKVVENEYALINSYVSFFRQQSLSFLGEDRQIVVILLSQVNREGLDYATRNNGAYKMSQIAEASEIERASSYIITVHTNAMSQASKLFKMGALKLRNAALPMDTVNVYADGEHYCVGEIVDVPKMMDYTSEDVFGDSGSQLTNEPPAVDPYSQLNDELLAGDIEALLRGEY